MAPEQHDPNGGPVQPAIISRPPGETQHDDGTESASPGRPPNATAITARIEQLRRLALIWFTRERVAAGLLGISYFLIFLWPRTHLFVVAAWTAGLLGGAGALLLGLTFLHTVRVRIGRSGMRYRQIRLIAATVATIGLSLFAVQRAGLKFRSPAGANGPVADENRFGVGIVHFVSDPDHLFEKQFAQAIGDLNSSLRVQVLRFDATLPSSGMLDEVDTDHIQMALTMLLQSKARMLIRGEIRHTDGRERPQLYETPAIGGRAFGGAALPRDFRFPDLPPAYLVRVVRLVVASESLNYFSGVDRPDLTLIDPLIEPVRALADDTAGRVGWSADTRARVNFIVANVLRNGGELSESDEPLRAAIVYYLAALGDWNAARNPLEQAMAQSNLGLTLYHLAKHEGGTESIEGAIKCFRASLQSYTRDAGPLDWAIASANLGDSLVRLSERDDDNWDAHLKEALAALTDALAVYTPNRDLARWADIASDRASVMDNLGQREHDPKMLQDAVAIYNNILIVYARDRSPLK
jgi:hypothetical protein